MARTRVLGQFFFCNDDDHDDDNDDDDGDDVYQISLVFV